MTTSTMLFEFADVVLVPFPFTDQSTSKKRPAVVVSGGAYNRARPDIVVMAITSQVAPNADPMDVRLAGWREAGLLKPSAIKPVLATLDRRLVLRRLGRLTGADIAALRGWFAANLT